MRIVCSFSSMSLINTCRSVPDWIERTLPVPCDYILSWEGCKSEEYICKKKKKSLFVLGPYKFTKFKFTESSNPWMI